MPSKYAGPSMRPLNAELLERLLSLLTQASSLRAVAKQLGVSDFVISKARTGEPLQVAKLKRLERALENVRPGTAEPS
jgi:hypothetical protein